MFAGAVVLVVLSPKCVLKKEPEWWRKHVSYQIFTPSFRDSNNDGIGDFSGIKEKLNDLRKVGIQTIWVTPVIATQKDDFLPLDVVDFASVDERFGTTNDLKLLIDEAHQLDMHFTMDLPISTTSASHSWLEYFLFVYPLAAKEYSYNDDSNNKAFSSLDYSSAFFLSNKAVIDKRKGREIFVGHALRGVP
ncbi:unnamed protein product [Gongylonema pulchrum]|uniref:Aamy domain-containing protein n=1 Tax=Gongylonema pulchrum TaxID=637853 RepID=A0A183D7Q4_9BILA|nr:unnamed protein product [Gongylonema pulchrum]